MGRKDILIHGTTGLDAEGTVAGTGVVANTIPDMKT